ncbi:MAG: hypothetical protein AAGF12_03905 [Myxococcota bacterium]
MGFIVLLLVIFPFMSADYCFMIPTFMVIVSAVGPLHGLAQQRPSCRRCRLELE